MAKMRPLNILLLGKNGQVGWELQRSLAPLGKVTALDRNGKDELCGDISNLEGLRQTIQMVKPDILVNAAAYTGVDKAQSEPEMAYRLNHEAPALMAELMKVHGGCLVHYSTDYVFDGSGSKPWKETSPTGPLNVYGATKLGGEQAIDASGCLHLIFRTSWVYASRGNNFGKTMLSSCEYTGAKEADNKARAQPAAESDKIFAKRMLRQSIFVNVNIHILEALP